MGIIRRRFFVTFWGTKGKGIWFGIYKRLRVFLSLLCIGFGSYFALGCSFLDNLGWVEGH